MFCSNLLHCVAVCCSVTLCTRQDDQFFAALCCSVLKGVVVCCMVLQCVAVCCSVLQCNLVNTKIRSFLALSVLHSLPSVAFCCSVLPSVAVCCLLLQCVAFCCSVLPSVAFCCSVLPSVAVCCLLLPSVAVGLFYKTIKPPAPMNHVSIF